MNLFSTMPGCVTSHIKQVVLSILFMASVIRFVQAEQLADYGAKIKYEENHPVFFPDFNLTFSGIRRVVPQQYPRGFVIYDFVIKNQSEQETVSWSAGTGDMGPQEFDFMGQKFSLELKFSDKLGRLDENEVVINKFGDLTEFQGLRLEISLSEKPETVNLKFTNISKDKIYLFFSDCPVEFLNLFVFDESGQLKLSETGVMHARACMPSDAKLQILEPRKYFGREIGLNRLFSLPRGHYQIEYRYSIPDYWKHLSRQKQFSDTFQGYENDYWKGHIVSNRITVDME